MSLTSLFNPSWMTKPVIQQKVSYLKDIKFLWFTLGISGLLFTAYLWRVYKACHHISQYSIRLFVDLNLKFPKNNRYNFDIRKENRKSKRQARAWKNLKDFVQFIRYVTGKNHQLIPFPGRIQYATYF